MLISAATKLKLFILFVCLHNRQTHWKEIAFGLAYLQRQVSNTNTKVSEDLPEWKFFQARGIHS